MTGIKVFSRTLNSCSEVVDLSANNSLGLTLEVTAPEPFELKIYGVCSAQVSLWRTYATCAFRSSLEEDKDQIHLRLPVAGSFRFERGQTKSCSPEINCLVAASATNPFLSDGPLDILCLELSRQKTEKHVSWLMQKDFRFTTHCTELQFCRDDFIEFRDFLIQTHDAVIKTEGEIDVVYPLFEEMLISKFAILMSKLRAFQAQSRLDPVTKLAVGFIDNNLQAKIGIPEILRATGVSARTLEKKFKQDLGTTPIAFLINRRLEKVHAEITDPTRFEYISQIAMKWGFLHMADFGRRFKQKYGKAPSEVRGELKRP